MAETVEFGFLAGYTDGDGFDQTPDHTNDTDAFSHEVGPPYFELAGQDCDLPEGCGRDEDLDCDFIPVDILRPDTGDVLEDIEDDPF